MRGSYPRTAYFSAAAGNFLNHEKDLPLASSPVESVSSRRGMVGYGILLYYAAGNDTNSG